MPRTPAKAHALSFALLLGTAACASGGRAPARPMPAASIRLPAPAPTAQGPEQIQESFQITGAPGAVRGNLLGNARYDLPVEANRWVEMELDFLVNQRRAVIGTWLSRADRYQGFVQETFASYGIPRDLHHLAMVESGYLPTARSSAGAVGMWQFMATTGRGMGLRIDDTVDERMDPVRATHAAARHLRDLHRDFRGDWALAAAAYNAGSGRINRGLGRFGATNFWDLAERGDLAQETRHYVPRLFAVTIIGRDPARFGYPAPAVRPFRPDSVRVDIETPVAELAKIASLNVTELTELNPHLFRGIAPAGYKVWTPTGSGPAIQAAFDTSAFRRSGGYGWYTLRRGENVAQLATAAGITLDRIRELNLSLSVERLGAGDRVRLPAPAARTLAARPVERERLASVTDEPRGPSSPELDAARADARRARAARREQELAAEARRAEEREARRVEERAAAARRTEERAAEARRLAARDAEEKPKEEESTSRRAASDDAPRRTTEERVASRASSDDAKTERPSASRAASDDETKTERPSAARPRRATSDDSSSERPTPRRASEDSSSERTTRTTPRRASADSSSERTTRTTPRRASEDSSTERTPRPTTRRASADSASERTTRTATRRASEDSSETRTTARRSSEESTPRTATRRASEDAPSEHTTRRASADSSSERSTHAASRETPRRTGETTERAEVRARTHTVERGETLRGLAEQYGVTVAQLRAANEIPAGEGVEVGQRLRLPRAAGSSTTLASAAERAARARAASDESGTRSSTSERRTARPDSSARRTAAKDEDAPRPRSTASRDSSTARPRSTTSRDSSATRPRSNASRDSSTTRRAATTRTATERPSQHTVKTGETLYGIAREYKVEVAALREANGLQADSTIQPGQKLRIPR